MTKIKVCGITKKEEVEYINEVMPDYTGFVFWEKSRRNLSYEAARELSRLVDPEIKKIGVFVDADNDYIIKLCRDGIIDGVQLHGRETNDVIRELKENLPDNTFIIKAFEVSQPSDLSKAAESCADMVLLDSGKGSGRIFEWEMLDVFEKPFMLAGGLSCHNVEEAICKYKPYAVDVSSGVETDGKKDFQKIKDFCDKVRKI